MTSPVQVLKDKAHEQSVQYADGAERPLAGYVEGMSVYAAGVAALTALARVQRRPIPAPTPFEVLLIAAATHKLSRLIAKENITSVLRAPFTRYAGTAGPAELHEEVRGSGVRHAIGELLTCPFCLAQWTATGFTFGFVFAPRATRLAATTMTAVAASDFLQLAYAWGQQKAE